MNLEQGLGKGLRWSIVGTTGAAITQLVTIYLLTRLIPVYDFGMMSLIQTLLGFGFFFTDAGLSNALIIQPSVSAAQYRTFWYLSLGIGLCFCVLFLGLFEVLSSLGFTDVRLLELCCLSGIILFLQSAGSVHKSILKKSMKFKVLNIIDLVTVLSSSALAVWLAYQGMGIYALIALPLSNAMINTALILYNGRHAFAWVGTTDRQTINQWWRFGLYQLSDRVISFLNTRSDTMMIAHYLGLESLGLYEVLKQLIARPIILIGSFFGPVMLPFISKISSDADTLLVAYHRLLRWTVMLSFPIYAMIGVLSPVLCNLYLGAAWSDQSHLLAIMSMSHLLMSTAMFSMMPSIAKANARLSFRWNLCYAIITIIVLNITAPMGLTWVTLGFCAVQGSLILPTYFVLLKPYLQGQTSAYFGLMFKPFMFSILTAGIIFIPTQLGYIQYWPQLIAVAVLGLVIYAVLNRVFNTVHWRNLVSVFIKLEP